MKERGFLLRLFLFIGLLLITAVLSMACGQHKPAGEAGIEVEPQGVSVDLPESSDILDLPPVFTGPESWEVVLPDFSQFITGAEQCLCFTQCLVAELDGREPLEVVVKLDFYLAEDYHNTCILVYSIENPVLAHLVACEVTPRPGTGPGWLEAIDINADGVDEIVIVTDMDETGTASVPDVYTLDANGLRNVVQGSYHIPAYYNCGLPLGGAFSRNVPLKIVHEMLSGRLQAIVLKGSESGFCVVTEVKASQRESAFDVSGFMEAVAADAQQGYISRRVSLKE